jgi:hypothetical protein
MRQPASWHVARAILFLSLGAASLAPSRALAQREPAQREPAQSELAQGEPVADGEHQAPRFPQPGGPFAASRQSSPAEYREQLVTRWNTQLESTTGLLFVDRQYIAPPYQVELDDEQIIVDGVALDCRAPGEDLSAQFQPHWGPKPFQIVGDILSTSLNNDQFVIALPGQPIIVLTNVSEQKLLLKLLGAKSSSSLDVKNVSANFPPPGIDAEAWNQFLRGFEPSPEFLDRAGLILTRYDEAERENMAEVAATHRLQNFSYPLSMLGMIGTVIGFGHLLTHRPPVGKRPLETDASPLAVQVLYYSLALVVLYSALDLAWTILAHQAGQMVEVNPLGSRLIHNIWQLVAFKVGATGIAVGLLLILRNYCRAQLAAWWICLVLTLLTARWLMMSSLYAV